MSNTQRVSVALLVLAAAAFGAYRWFFTEQTTRVGAPDQLTESAEALSAAEQLPDSASIGAQPRALTGLERPSRPEAADARAAAGQAMADLAAWERRIGKFTESDYGLYDSYPNETLWLLGSEGDLLALDLLARRQRQAGDMAQLRTTLSVALLFGSLEAMTDVAAIDQANLSMAREARNASSIKEHGISIAAWYEASVLLGNLDALGVGEAMLAQAGIEFSAADLLRVTELAQTRIATINETRRSMGLEPLTRQAMPESVRRNTQAVLRHGWHQNRSGWGRQYYEQLGIWE